ncbi:hypothetical protein Shyhy01_38010 [Streptomyces hygroscopicus subsp. hygroscopicus]|nr:hypothetical protein Shyhy01_38010 [Streptomyces hygroscopicus subsp. hygroscopicus]
MLDEAVPGQLEHLEHVPLGDGLLDAPGEGRCGEFGPGTGDDRLVSGAQGDSSLLQLVLDLRAEVSAAGDAFDRLANNGSEAAIGALGLFEEVGDAAVAWDRDLEVLVG